MALVQNKRVFSVWSTAIPTGASSQISQIEARIENTGMGALGSQREGDQRLHVQFPAEAGKYCRQFLTFVQQRARRRRFLR
ncbi:MAG: hypothetical protein R3D83_10040 [Caenibius sp.]